MSHHRLAEVIGHRGVPYKAPENSLAGFRLAARLGYTWCELDAQASSDGDAVVHHDFRIKSGVQVSEMSTEELARTDIGKDGDGEVQCVPTLAQCLTVAVEQGFGLVVEIKTKKGREGVDVEAVAKTLSASKLPSGLMVSSFSATALKLFKDCALDMPLALNVDDIEESDGEEVANVHFDAVYASEAKVRRLLDMGYGAYAYTVNKESEKDRLLSMGVHGVFTDNPGLLADL